MRADTRRHQAAAEELIRLLLADAEHAAHNRAVLAGWASRWAAESTHAAEAVAPLSETGMTATGETFSGCLKRVLDRQHALLAALGLTG